MSNDFGLFPVKDLWQSEPAEPQKIAIEDLRRKMDKLERSVFWRNIREYVAGAFVIGIFGYYELKFTTLILRIGSGMIIAGTLYALFQLHRKGSVAHAPAEMALSTCLDFQRQELERQRNALRAVWTWYLLPFVPGLCVFLVGLFDMAMDIARAAGRPTHAPLAALMMALVAAMMAAVLFAVWKMNAWAANKLQAQIDELGRLARDPQ